MYGLDSGARLDEPGYSYFFFLAVSAALAVFLLAFLGGRGTTEHFLLYYLLFILSIPLVVSIILGSLIYIVLSSFIFLPSTLVEYGFFMLFGFLSVVHMFMLSILFNAASDDFDKFDDELITHVSVMALLGFLLYYLDLFGF